MAIHFKLDSDGLDIDRVRDLEAEYKAAHPNRVFAGEGDSPEEAESDVQRRVAKEMDQLKTAGDYAKARNAEGIVAEMREMESAVERDYDQALKTTDPNSLIGQIVRHFPPMSGEQLMARLTRPSGATVDSAGRPLNTIDDPAPTPTPPSEPMLQLFNFRHLQDEALRDVSYRFYILAHWIAENLPRNPERTVCLRKLREAKDCAITAKLWKEVGQ